MERIKTQEDIEVFLNKLHMANIQLPENVAVVITLDKYEYKDILPFDVSSNVTELKYSSEIGNIRIKQGDV